jgi:hypothetical protein
MGSTIAGWILFGLGVLMYLIGIFSRFRRLIGGGGEEGLEGIEDIVDAAKAIAKLAEVLNKFSEDIQFILLGTGALLAGLYLLTNQPF